MASVKPQTPFNLYDANGVATVYPYEFELLAATDLVVTLDGAIVAPNDYAVSGVGVQDGGVVTFGTAPSGKLLLERVIVLERDTDYQLNGDFREVVVDRDFNRIWMAIQGQATVLSRAVRGRAGEVFNELPVAAVRAGKLLGFDSNGLPIVLAPADGSAAALALALAVSSGTDLIGYGNQTLTQALEVIRTVDNFKLPSDPNDALSFIRMAEFSNGSIRLAAREYVVGQLNLPLYERLQIVGAGIPTASAGLDRLVGGSVIVGGINARAGHVVLRDFGVDNGGARGATGAVDGLVVNSPTGLIGAEAILESLASMGPTAAGTTHAVLVQGYERGSARGIYCAKHQFGLVSKNRNFVIHDVDGDDLRTALVYPKSDVPAFAGDVGDGTAANYEISNVQHRAGVGNTEASAVYLHASTASFASARVVNVSQQFGLAALRIQGYGTNAPTDPAISGVRASNIRSDNSQYTTFASGYTYDWRVQGQEAINPRTGRIAYMDTSTVGWSMSGIHATISDSTITGDILFQAFGEGSWDDVTVRNPFRTMRVHQTWDVLSTVKTGKISGQCRNTYDQDLIGINGAAADVSPTVPRMRILPGSVMKLEGRFNTTASALKFLCNLPVSTGRQMVFACAALDSGGNYVNQAVRLNDGQLSVEPTLLAGLQRIDISNITVAL